MPLTGAKKSSNSGGKLCLSALLAGFFIAAGAVVANTAGHMLTNAGLSRVVCGLLFPFGLIMVILTGAELFTGNCMITISLLEKQAGLAGMVRNLAVVYGGNFVGAALLAAAVAYGGAFSNTDLAVYALRTAANKCALPFGRAVVLGILCNVSGVRWGNVFPVRQESAGPGHRSLCAGELLCHWRL